MAGFDDIKDKNLLSSKGSELLKARQERVQNKSVQEVRILEKMAQDLQEIDKLTNNLDVEFDKKLQEISRLSHRVEEMKKAVAQAEKGRAHGADKMFKQAAMTMTSGSATMADVGAASRSSMMLGPALTMAQNQSTATLEDYIAGRKSLLARANERVRESAQNIDGNEGQFSTRVAARDRLVGEIGQAQAAMTAQKRLGIDAQSQYYSANDLTAKVRAEQERGQIQSGVKEGQFGNRKQVEEALDAAAKRLISTFERLDSAVKSKDESEKAKVGELSKTFGEVEKEYKKQKDILGEMNRQGSGPSGLQTAGGIISNLGTIGMGVSQGARYIGVTSEMTQAQNRIGMAQMANSRFSDAYGATQGDMGALRRVMSDQYSEQVKRGLLLSGREDAAKLGETVSSGAKAIGTGIDAATGAGGIVSGVKGFFMGGPAGASAAAVTEGLAKATPDALAFTQNMTDYAKQNTQMQTFLASQQQQKQLMDAVAQISDFSSQAAADQNKGLTYATRGLGIGGGGPGANYGAATMFSGTGMLGTDARGILPVEGGQVGPRLSGGGPVDLSAVDGDEFGGLKKYIKGKEGFSATAYADTSRGYSIGYGSFQKGTSQKGQTISRPDADKLFEKDFASHSGAVNDMLGDDVMGKLNTGQKSALYDLAYNAGPGALKYGRKGQSIYSRLKAGDIDGAGQKILSTATTADGAQHPGLVGRRQDEYAMWTGANGGMPSGSMTGSLTTSGIQGGGDRQNVQAMLSNPEVIKMIASQAGLSGKDVTRLVGQGVGGLGKEFARDGGMGATNDITRAGQLSRIGYMQSPDQYMQARSAMTGVGGGAEDFEEILKNAVANGMDASKNIMEMVSATTQLAGRSAGAGIAAFGGAAEGLGRGIDVLRGTGVSENMATAAAARAAGVAEDVTGSKDLDIANVIETARLRKDFGKASLSQLESMRTASPAELSQLEKLYRGGKTAQAEEMTIKMGLYGAVNNADDVSKIQRASREQGLRRATGFGINRQMEESIINKDEKDLTKEERSFMNAMTRSNLGKDVSGDAFRGYLDNRRGASRGTLATDPGGGVAGGEDQIRSGAMGDARVFESGVKNITDAMGGLEALGANMVKIADGLKVDEFAKSVVGAAADFKVPANALGTNIKELNTSVGELVKAIKGMSGGKIDLPGQVNMNQIRK